MTEAVKLALIALAGVVVTAVVPLVVAMLNRRTVKRTEKKVDEIGHHVDGQMSRLLETVGQLDANTDALKREIARLQNNPDANTPTTRNASPAPVTIADGVVTVEKKT